MSRTPRPRASDFDPDVMRLFDEYVHGLIDRRGFLLRSARYAGAAGAASLLAALNPRFAQAQQVAPDDARIEAQYHEFESPKGHGTGRGYLVQPAGADAPLPLVLVVHENRGLNPHIEDITRRLALANFIAFAPDALFPLGGYPGEEDKARALFGTLDQDKSRQDFIAAAHWLKGRERGNGHLGAVGFCYGGSMVNFLATQLPELLAAVPFYGSAPALDQVASIKAELLVVQAANDDRVNASWPPFEAALKEAGINYRMRQYAGTMHGFNNDTTPRYDEAAAAMAWDETLKLFERTLRESGKETD